MIVMERLRRYSPETELARVPETVQRARLATEKEKEEVGPLQARSHDKYDAFADSGVSPARSSTRDTDISEIEIDAHCVAHHRRICPILSLGFEKGS